MAKRNRTNQEDELLAGTVDAQEQSQGFLEDNQSLILGGLLLAVLLIGCYIAYTQFYQGPREKEAMQQMFRAENQFQRDSFALALNNPGDGYPGFASIAEDYSGTKAGNLANYYAGLASLQMGEFQQAVDYLNNFSAAGEITPAMSNGALGDAYSELENFDKAISAYEKAANSSDNEFSTPYYLWKAGLLADKMGNSSKAQAHFSKIKEKYPNSVQGQDIDGYLN